MTDAADSRFNSTAFVGHVSIIACNILVPIFLIAMRTTCTDAGARLCLLGMSNLAMSTVLLLPMPNAMRGRQVIIRDTIPLVMWSASYCVIYGSFLLLPRLLNLSHVIIANSTAPFVAIFASGDWSRSRERLLATFMRASPLCLLMLVAMVEWKTVDQSYSASIRWLALGMLIVLAVVSQWMARILARHHSAMWAPPRLAAFNGVLLLATSTMLDHTLTILPAWKWTTLPLVFGAGIFVIQMLYLYGLKTTHPTLSVLLLSTSVPISIAVEYLWSGVAHSSWSAILGILYCGHVGIVTLFARRSCLAPRTITSEKLSLSAAERAD
jgi:drug/metabolite transporter (DMT)-like permease